MNKNILTVTLNPALDVVISGQKKFFTAGGKGVNVARVLKSLKCPVQTMGLAGGSTGRHFLALLKSEKIKGRFVEIEGETRINYTYIDHRVSRRRKIGAGPKVSSRELEEFQGVYEQMLRNVKYVVLSGRNANGAPDDLYAGLIQTAVKKRAKVVLDSSGVPFRQGLIAKPNLIKPNKNEAEEIVRFKLNSIEKIKKAINIFHGMGVRQVIVSLGKDGAVGSDGKEVWMAHPPRIDVRNEVGCGDTLLAMFLISQIQRKAFGESLRRSVAYGSASCLNIDPRGSSQGPFIKILEQVKLKKI